MYTLRYMLRELAYLSKDTAGHASTNVLQEFTS